MSSYDEYQQTDESYGSYNSSAFAEDLEAALSAGGGGDAGDARPRILLMGTRRSGKSSIAKVVFQKMSPHETLFLESTNDLRVREIATSALVQFTLIDFPGNYDFSTAASANAGNSGAGVGPNAAAGGGGGGSGAAGTSAGGGGGGNGPSRVSPKAVFGGRPCALVFVIDAQDDENHFAEAIDYFLSVAKIAARWNPKMTFDVLIHKVDGDAYLSEEHKTECQNDIRKHISEELVDSSLQSIVRPSFHLTSIYDHSIFEAFSKIVQSLIPQLALLEKLLDALIASCAMEKAFLFDVVSKIYVATDSNPVDMQTYELCSDMIDVVIDVSCIYGLRGNLRDSLAYDADSASVIKLSNEYVLYLREVNKYLALVCLMRADSYAKSGLIDYNFTCFKQAIAHLLDAKSKLNTLAAADSASSASSK